MFFSAGGPRTVTVEELKERTKVTNSQLDTEIEETDMIILADHFDHIGTSTLFGLNPSQQHDVIRENFQYDTQAAMFLAMKLWRRRNPAAATYRALVEIVLSLRKVDVATEVCEFLAHKCECLYVHACMVLIMISSFQTLLPKLRITLKLRNHPMTILLVQLYSLLK